MTRYVIDAMLYRGERLRASQIACAEVETPAQEWDMAQMSLSDDHPEEIGSMPRPPQTYWSAQLIDEDPTGQLMRRYRSLQLALTQLQGNRTIGSASHALMDRVERRFPGREVWRP